MEDGNVKSCPSVTTIIKDVGFYPWVFKEKKDDGEIKFPTEEENNRKTAAMRGTEVHQITEDMDRGNHIDPIDLELLPYVNAYKTFREENEIEIVEIEQIVYSQKFWYAGALDRVMTINGIPSIVDLKTGAELDTTGIQLAAYQFAFEEMGGEKGLARFALHLKKNGNYKLVPYRGCEDLANFLGAARVYHFKRRNDN
jgi:hypothetical protein